MQPGEKPSRYDRLGGVYSIATVIDNLIDRDGLLGYGRPTKIQWQVDGGLSCPFEDYRRGVGGVPGRLSADAG
jgi:hypothetical protein